jgi:hypothetical protein
MNSYTSFNYNQTNEHATKYYVVFSVRMFVSAVPCREILHNLSQHRKGAVVEVHSLCPSSI